MARSRQGVGGPKTDAGRARAMANLVPFREEKDRHGLYAVTPDQLDTKALAKRILDILNAEVALIRPADEVAVNVLACVLRRLDQADKYLSRHGLVNHKGQVRPVAALVPQLAREALGYLTALGATPQARVRLGLAAGRAFDLASEIASLGGESVDSPGGGGEQAPRGGPAPGG